MIVTMPSIAVIEEAVSLACRAPSLHNSQPWRWVADRSAVQLFSDSDRLLPSTDTSGRQLLISCGAVLGHFRAAMAAAGWRTLISRFPNPNSRELLASITFHPADFVTDAERERAAAIELRHTDRLPFSEPVRWKAFEPILRDTVRESGVEVHVLAESCRPQLADASALTAALRRYDSAYHLELHWRTGHSVTHDGVPQSALISQAEHERVALGRAFPTTEPQSRRGGVAEDRATVLVLATDGDTPLDLLRTGEALSTVLLECTLAGYATCPLTHMIEVPQSRKIIRTFIGGAGEPQVLIRVGTVPPGDEQFPATPHRLLSDVLEIHGN